MIAERAAIVVELVHGGDHGMHVAGLHALAIGNEIAERRALDQVAVIEEQAVLGLGPRALHQRRGACQAHRVVGRVAIIVIGA